MNKVELQENKTVRQIGRKDFLGILGILTAGFFILRSIPFKLFSKDNGKVFNNSTKIAVKSNPLSIKRQNTGGTNV